MRTISTWKDAEKAAELRVRLDVPSQSAHLIESRRHHDGTNHEGANLELAKSVIERLRGLHPVHVFVHARRTEIRGQ
jgi:hypothetical protein